MQMQQILFHFFACATFLNSSFAATAKTPPSSDSIAAESQVWPIALKAQLAVLHDVDWRIRTAVAQACQGERTGSGALLDSLTSYDPSSRQLIKSSIGLGPAPQIIAIASDSPAALAGLREGDQIVEINNRQVSVDYEENEPASPAVLATQRLIDSNHAGEATRLTVQRHGELIQVEIVPTLMCDGWTQLIIDNDTKAYSDETNVALTTGMVGFFISLDEMAFVVGHEIAHTIYKDSLSKELSRKEKERRADKFAAFAMVCAGFDNTAVTGLMERLREKDWLAPLRDPTHPSYKKRGRAVANYVPKLNCNAQDSVELIGQNARS